MNAIQGFIEANQAVIGLVMLAVMFVAFARERYPVSVVAVIGACGFVALGMIDYPGLFSAFSNSGALTIAAMFILSGALIRTGVIDVVANAIVARAAKRPRLAIVETLLAAMVASAFVNNTPVVVVLIPIIFRLADATGVPVKKLMMPLSIVAVLGGVTTLIGTSTNLIVDGIAQDEGLAPFGIFEITPYGIAAALAGLTGLLALSWLLPSDPPKTEAEEVAGGDYLTELVVGAQSGAIGKTIAALKLDRQGVRLIGVKRGRALTRRDLDDWELKAGDQLVARADGPTILTLRESDQFELGLSSGMAMASGDGEVIEGMIAPTHPSIGRRVADLPALQRLRVRVLGIGRERHLPGPDLANARVRGADRLLVAGGEESIRRLRDDHNWMGVNASRARAFRRRKAWVAIGAMIGVVTLSALNVLPIAVAAMIAVGVILVARCIDGEEAWRSIDGDVLILIFSMLVVGKALEQTGSVALMVEGVVPLLLGVPYWAMIFIVYFFALILSELLSNNAVAALMTPLTIALAVELGVDPRPLVIALMIGASVCLATPIGYQTNMMVYAAADYRFTDFLKIGVPLNIIAGLAACAAIAFLP